MCVCVCVGGVGGWVWVLVVSASMLERSLRRYYCFVNEVCFSTCQERETRRKI